MFARSVNKIFNNTKVVSVLNVSDHEIQLSGNAIVGELKNIDHIVENISINTIRIVEGEESDIQTQINTMKFGPQLSEIQNLRSNKP